MKRVIRQSIFETNSSSSHAITFKTKGDKELGLYQKRLKEIKFNDERLHILVGACQLEMSNSLYELSDMFCQKVDIYEIEYGNVTNAIMQSNSSDELLQKIKDVDEIKYVIVQDENISKEEACKQFINTHPLFDNYFKFKGYINEIINTFAKFEGTTYQKAVDEYDLFDMRGEPICTRLFNRNPLGDCNCGIEQIFDLIGVKYANMTELANAVFSEQLILFTCEGWQTSYCDIERVLKGEEENWD